MKIKFLSTGSAINIKDTGASLLINENIFIDAPGNIFPCPQNLKTQLFVSIQRSRNYGL
jgi:hypothetical protein